jgi:hypothetical protein
MKRIQIASTIKLLSTLSTPLWLTGGVAVDFHVGRWTRTHKYIDLIAFITERRSLEIELNGKGILLSQDGSWTTRWSVGRAASADVEIIFAYPYPQNSGYLKIPDNDPTGAVPGEYHFIRECLNPNRVLQLDDIRFRTCSAEGEWLSRQISGKLVRGRKVEPKIMHDISLLESLVSEKKRREVLCEYLAIKSDTK